MAKVQIPLTIYVDVPDDDLYDQSSYQEGVREVLNQNLLQVVMFQEANWTVVFPSDKR